METKRRHELMNENGRIWFSVTEMILAACQNRSEAEKKYDVYISEKHHNCHVSFMSFSWISIRAT